MSNEAVINGIKRFYANAPAKVDEPLIEHHLEMLEKIETPQAFNLIDSIVAFRNKQKEEK